MNKPGQNVEMNVIVAANSLSNLNLTHLWAKNIVQYAVYLTVNNSVTFIQ